MWKPMYGTKATDVCENRCGKWEKEKKKIDEDHQERNGVAEEIDSLGRVNGSKMVCTMYVPEAGCLRMGRRVQPLVSPGQLPVRKRWSDGG